MFKKLRKRYSEFVAHEKRQREEQEINQRYEMAFDRLGLSFPYAGSVCKDVGTAIKVMRDYGIELHIGTCYSQCRAVLHQSNWKNQIDGNVCSFNYGTFTHKQPHEVDAISGFGWNVCHAVTTCLINARMAGVI